MAKNKGPTIHTQAAQKGKSITEPSHSGTTPPTDTDLIKTTFYPTQAQLDTLDDLAAEYNKHYRRQRKKIDRQDIIRFLLDKLGTLDDLADLHL